MRPSPRLLFLEPSKRLNVRFYTSNIPKYLQAKLVFDSFGLPLHHFRSRTEPYTESYDLGKENLLINAIDEIKADIGRSSLFFVEDTSLRIEALSTPEADYPGLAVKEWFASTSFESLSSQLAQDLEERRATVKSDIALHVPGLSDPILFHGETSGTIPHSPPDFAQDPHHPWLTPSSFNGWFIPDGASRRLGEMTLEESCNYDFRVHSLTALIQRLEEYAALLNAPPDCYTTVLPISPSRLQPTLFSQSSKTLIIVGATCAGKTTFGLLASNKHQDLRVVEASNVVRSYQRRKDAALTPPQFAEHLLKERGADIVAHTIIRMYRLQEPGDIMITGFRTIQELEIIRQTRPDAKVVLIEAFDKTRYARHLHRGRGVAMSYTEFLALDRAQWAFGLLRVAEDFADIKIINEGSIADYEKQVLAVMANPDEPEAGGISIKVKPRHNLPIHRLFRCLTILEAFDRPMTCDEIEEVTLRQETLKFQDFNPPENELPRYIGRRITQNNVNKVLKEAPELAQRIEAPSQRVQYAITDTGRAYIRLMKTLSQEAGRQT